MIASIFKGFQAQSLPHPTPSALRGATSGATNSCLGRSRRPACTSSRLLVPGTQSVGRIQSVRPQESRSDQHGIVDDPRGIRAAEVVGKLHAGLIQYWKDKRHGRDRDAEMRYQQACERSRSLGFNYVPAGEAASTLPIEEILRRFENLARREAVDNTRDVTALLGGAQAPVVTTDAMLDDSSRSCAPRSHQSLSGRNKSGASHETPLEVFVDLVGSRPISTLTRADALKLRAHWQDRVVAGEVKIGTANKCIGHIGTMFRAINESKQLNLPAIFDRIRIGGGRDGQRLAFTPAFVQDQIPADGMFDDLNSDARRVVYLVVETGLRLSEAISLSRTTIRLDAAVPHICVAPEGRDVKTNQSKREIPLVGVALMAMREQPDGFPRYRDKADVLSALVNKALDARGLRPQVGQSLYSLRHTFEVALPRLMRLTRSSPA